MNVYNVKFLFEDKNISPVTVKAAEGESILDVALENNIELCHNCGGVCACTTCHVYIEEGMENLSEMSEKEENYVDRAINPRINSRLACQSQIFGDVIVTIPDQSVIIGH
jgi:2Fe-2S ferredoxin